MRIQTAALFLLLLIALTKVSYAAGCSEYKIVDHGDHVEAVCIGEPLTEAEKKELERQKKEAQEIELQRQRAEFNQSNNPSTTGVTRRTYPGETASTISSITRPEIPQEGNVVVESYDIKYIPSPKPMRNGREYPGQYSIKIVAKNNGRKGTVRFKMKQTDFSGFETESLSFSEPFEKDQQKTVTTHVHAQQVPFIQSQSWIIETYK